MVPEHITDVLVAEILSDDHPQDVEEFYNNLETDAKAVVDIFCRKICGYSFWSLQMKLREQEKCPT